MSVDPARGRQRRAKAPAPGFHGHARLLFARHGYHPTILQEVTEVATALAFVKADLGLTLMPASLGSESFAGLGLHPLRDREARWTVGACWRRRNTSPLLERFLGLLRAQLGAPPT
jgi:DNA-binding transcriptional LysR family regulator